MRTIPIFYILISLIIFFLIFFYGDFNTNSFSKIKINKSEWNIKVASTMSERIQGLSDAINLQTHHGLLFIFTEKDLHGIWMKDMNFPIDIIWISEDFKIVSIKKDVGPESYPEVFQPEMPALYVLEVNAGDAEEAQINIGDIVEIF